MVEYCTCMYGGQHDSTTLMYNGVYLNLPYSLNSLFKPNDPHYDVFVLHNSHSPVIFTACNFKEAAAIIINY